MRKEDCFYLGKIARKHSFKGEVVVYLDTDEPENYQELESVLLAFGAELVPFFIEKSSIQKGNLLRTKFEDVNSEAAADAIMNCEVYLPLSFLPKLTGNKFYYHEVIGYKVVDVTYGEVGNIISINDSTAQPLFEVQRNEKELFIPMIDHFIKKVDKLNQTILVETPEGLIDLYL